MGLPPCLYPLFVSLVIYDYLFKILWLFPTKKVCVLYVIQGKFKVIPACFSAILDIVFKF